MRDPEIGADLIIEFVDAVNSTAKTFEILALEFRLLNTIFRSG